MTTHRTVAPARRLGLAAATAVVAVALVVPTTGAPAAAAATATSAAPTATVTSAAASASATSDSATTASATTVAARATVARATVARATVAPPTEAGTPVVPGSDADGTPLVAVTPTSTATQALRVDGAGLGEVRVVPGDAGSALLRVRNDGPTAGTLTVSIVDAEALRRTDDDTWTDDAFYDDLTVNGVPASQLEGRRTRIQEVPLARGATVDVPLTYDLPVEATTGNTATVGERRFSFDLLLVIAGDTPDGTGTTPDPADPTPAEPTPPAVAGTTGRGGTGTTATVDRVGGPLTRTGGVLAPDRRPWLLLAGAALVVVAGSAARALRRPAPTRRAGG
ncbi:hypothetical protein SAMN05518682_3805 [Cellulosimicrobium aquatile]|uniref:Uncharacterized protein n=1 Tax=Cellulosimicrobium aquatile TaxID=1612203 RepID=A0A1N6W2V2_9MICO|nr:hypothetical protein [Cellulosimicrobium aquatile]SIQ84457.1 hypothetical protein SAMN05518682_3805 [Cellulosimicrobium aquatile]